MIKKVLISGGRFKKAHNWIIKLNISLDIYNVVGEIINAMLMLSTITNQIFRSDLRS